MTLWRYTAIPAAGGPQQSGELSGESAAEVRAALRRIGLQPLELKAAGRNRAQARFGLRTPGVMHRMLRSRRTARKAELFDGLATMLDAGVPLHEALTLAAGKPSRRSVTRELLLDLADQVKGGDALAQAMTPHAGWFDRPEVAMVEAGQARGELSSVLQTLSERHQRSGELSAKLVGVLTYPAIIAMVGLGVVAFLSTKTLPDLVGILAENDIDPPGLTLAVMAFGRWLVRWGVLGLIVLLAAMVCIPWIAQLLARRGRTLPIARLLPPVVKRAALAEAWLRLAELVRVGIPLVDALRITSETARGPASTGLQGFLGSAARDLIDGATVGDAFDDPRWVTGEHRRLIELGERGGELGPTLERLGERELRSARRLVDRLSTWLEPAVIITLAGMVGLIVMAAILPLARLQEIVR